MTTSVSAVPANILRTATGREALRWVLDHCRTAPGLPIATVLATVAGAVLQIIPVFLLGTVVDGIVGGRTHSDRELERLRTVELVRAAARRHRLRRLLGR